MKIQSLILLLSGVFIVTPLSTFAHSDTPLERYASFHAPIGVMGDHAHKKGEWMLSYRYGNMYMKGNRDGSNSVTPADVLGSYMVSPLSMSMQMHMFGTMYGVNDRFTVMGMLPYKIMSMEHVNAANVQFTTRSEGIGDAKLSGLYTLYEQGSRRVLLNAGISFPTGSVDERDDTPAGVNSKLPYPMQLGSGTYDLHPAITYTDRKNAWSWGGQVGAIIRTGENSENYRLGNEYNATTWVARDVTHYTSVSMRLDAKGWEDIQGADAELNPAMVPTADPDLRAGERLDLLLGVNYIVPKGRFAGNRISLEGGMPLYERFDGAQLSTSYKITVGWQWTF